MDGILLLETELISKLESGKAYRERVVIDNFAVWILLFCLFTHTLQPMRMSGKLVQRPAERIRDIILASEEETDDGILDV